jgi:hypothetical protein
MFQKNNDDISINHLQTKRKVNLNVVKQIYNLKSRYDKKAFRRLLNVLSSLFDKHLSIKHIKLKVPSGEYGLSFVAC